jgi:transcriptional regulator GlxA family with amidase domain
LQDIRRVAARGWTEVTKSGPQVTAPIEIAIVCYPGAGSACIHGLTDLFLYADHFAREHAATSTAEASSQVAVRTGNGAVRENDRPFVRITHWRQRADGSDMECSFESLPEVSNTFRLVVLPGCQIAPPAPGSLTQAAAWVAGRHAEGATVAAVCGGVFLLADSGLLNGRRATTHWMFAGELQRRHPGLRVDPDRLVIDDSDIITAGGVLAWADMGLTLVERVLGRTVMCSTARFMLMDPPGREQRFYGEFTPPLSHGDKTIVSIQHWLQANSTVPCSVADLAERANLGTRTFLRRFVKATGMKPSEYHQRLRIARSREMLEFTRDTVDQIAVAAGYEDPRGFRRTFKRVIGLSPAEYRRRFQRAGARERS